MVCFCSCAICVSCLVSTLLSALTSLASAPAAAMRKFTLLASCLGEPRSVTICTADALTVPSCAASTGIAAAACLAWAEAVPIFLFCLRSLFFVVAGDFAGAAIGAASMAPHSAVSARATPTVLRAERTSPP